MKTSLITVFNIKPINFLMSKVRPALENKLLGFITVLYFIKCNDRSKRNEAITCTIILNSIRSE